MPAALVTDSPLSPSTGRRRRLLFALGLYVVTTAVFLLTTAPERLSSHTPFNHFALMADGWLHGRLDLGGPPPAYTGNNDFAVRDGKFYVSFPPFPAVLIAPFVKLSGGADQTRDGLFFGLLTGVAPALLFLALEKLARSGRSRRSERENLGLAALFAFGTVYWFSGVQGTVWFAAHVVGAALAAGYLYACIDAAHPILAGLCIGLGFATRTSLGFALPLYLYEAYRAACRADAEEGSPSFRIGRADGATLFEKLMLFGTPAALVLSALFWHNRARFADAFEFGHRYLAIGWRARIDKWGLFSYHYLGRNLAVVLTSLPYTKVAGTPFQINVHGLALWVTSPFLVWTFWPRRAKAIYWALGATALAVAAPSLLYQNSGWIQFGYRFSNDFAPFLFAAIAVGGRRLSVPFWLLGALAVVVNAFGALTFQRAEGARYYFVDGTQKVLHQPD